MGTQLYKMKFLTGLISAAAFLCVVHGEVFDIDWKYGMEDADTAICVPPGSQINFVWETNHNVVLMENKEDFELAPTFLTPSLMTDLSYGTLLARKEPLTSSAVSEPTALTETRNWPSLSLIHAKLAQ